MEIININKEDKGKLFVRRVQQVLKSHDNITVEELLEKVEEMKDLMITLAKMLRHTTHKMKKLQVEKDNLVSENKTVLQLLTEMENNLSNAEVNVKKFVTKCQQYEELKSQFDKIKAELSEIQKRYKLSENGITDSQPVLEIERKKSRKTQTNFQNNSGKSTLVKFENGVPIFDENSSDITNVKYDWNLHKLQTFLMHKEQTWHQISGREREQRTKLSRLIKEMKTLQNQLDWKNSQLSFKEAEVKEKTKMLAEAERKISDLKKYIRHDKRHKTINDASLFVD